MILLQLFWSFFQIGLFSFGGGYAALPLIQSQIVEYRQWINVSEFTDLITISQMTPGPIALNASSFVGIQVAGIPGAIVATFGNILPSCIISLILAYVYSKYKSLNIIKKVLGGLRPAVVAMIASAGVAIIINSFWGLEPGIIGIRTLNIFAVAIYLITLFVLRKFKVSPTIMMLACGGVGVVLHLFGISLA